MSDHDLPAGVIEPRSAKELAGVVPVHAIASDPAYHWLTYLDEELAQVRVPPFRLPIERDLYWTPAPLSEIASEYRR